MNPGLPLPLACSNRSGPGSFSGWAKTSRSAWRPRGRSRKFGFGWVEAQASAASNRRISASARSLRWCSAVMPAAETSTSLSTRCGCAIATSAAMNPPMELPITEPRSTPTVAQKWSSRRP